MDPLYLRCKDLIHPGRGGQGDGCGCMLKDIWHKSYQVPFNASINL
jgi:hypothetical protein